MADIGLQWNELNADMFLASNDIGRDMSLETAIIISLFSDRRALDDDALPDAGTDRRGWWGDSYPQVNGDKIGSRLWLLSREKQLPEVLRRAEEYAREALAWLVEDKVCTSYSVTASIVRTGVLGLEIMINKPDASALTYRYGYAWAAQEVKRG